MDRDRLRLELAEAERHVESLALRVHFMSEDLNYARSHLEWLQSIEKEYLGSSKRVLI